MRLFDVGRDPGLQPHPLAHSAALVSVTPGAPRLDRADEYIAIRHDDLLRRSHREPALSHRLLGDGDVLILAEAIVYRAQGTVACSPWQMYRVAPCEGCGHRHHYALRHYTPDAEGCGWCSCTRWSSGLLG